MLGPIISFFQLDCFLGDHQKNSAGGGEIQITHCYLLDTYIHHTSGIFCYCCSYKTSELSLTCLIHSGILAVGVIPYWEKGAMNKSCASF